MKSFLKWNRMVLVWNHDPPTPLSQHPTAAFVMKFELKKEIIRFSFQFFKGAATERQLFQSSVK
jgi:hypothetical protein